MSGRRCRNTDESGFTLIELLITVVIVGVITLPLGNLVIGYFQNTAQTQARANVSHDEQIAATYFSQDVASVGMRNPDLTAKPSVWYPSTSGAPITCGSGVAPFLAMAWDEYASSGTRTTSESVYGTRSQSDNGRVERQLLRLHCTNGSAVPDSTLVLAHNLVGTPTVACDGSGAACSSSAPLPSVVIMTVILQDPDLASSATYQIALTGQRRQT
jgi:prepilin-type N-terminal cleavage/methylation domain-containing protein